MMPKYPIEGVAYPSVENAERFQRCGAWHNLTAGNALRLGGTADAPDMRARSRQSAFDIFLETLMPLRNDWRRRYSIWVCIPANGQFSKWAPSSKLRLPCWPVPRQASCRSVLCPQHRAIEIGTLAERSGARAYFVQADFGAFDLVQFATEMAARLSIQHLIVARAREHTKGRFLNLDDLIQSRSLEQARAKTRQDGNEHGRRPYVSVVRWQHERAQNHSALPWRVSLGFGFARGHIERPWMRARWGCTRCPSSIPPVWLSVLYLLHLTRR